MFWNFPAARSSDHLDITWYSLEELVSPKFLLLFARLNQTKEILLYWVGNKEIILSKVNP